MKYNIKATKVELTPEIKAYVEKKLDMLDKYLGSIKPIDCHVNIGIAVGGQNAGDIYKTEISLSLPNVVLVIEKVEQDIFKSVDKVKDQLARAIVKHKEKMIDRRRVSIK
ncbi:MAG: ribosome-associated translation inhibitor RaiA [bacterium]